MDIRSQILIHWTEPRPQPFEVYRANPVDNYVDHIKSIYSKGLRFSVPNKVEEVHGALGLVSILPRIPMICYTELRLSDAGEHLKRYGHMGIGFKRDWLMVTCGANPVFYVQNTGAGVVSTNLSPIISKIKGITADPLEMFLCFVKPMSDYDDPSHQYYDEMEWRMVLWTFFEGGKRRPNPPWMVMDGSGAYFKFSPDDVEIIVTPNEDTRKAMLRNKDMKVYFDQKLPMIVDAASCSQF
jgi:hypothetical protein